MDFLGACDSAYYLACGVVILTLLGLVDVTYQYLCKDHRYGDRIRTVANMLLIGASATLYALARRPEVEETSPAVPLPQLVVTCKNITSGPFPASGKGAALAVALILFGVGCYGKRAANSWNVLSVDGDMHYPLE